MSRAAFAALEVRAGDHVLEVGFGGGELSALLIGAGVRVTGVDISEAMVRRARRRFAREVNEGRAVFLVGDAAALPVEGERFDAACSVNAIYFWRDLDAVLVEFARLLRREGTLLLSFQIAEAVRAWPGHRHGFIAWEEADVQRAVERAGFRVISTARGSDRTLGDYVSMTCERG